jgi:hypothetical protein
VTVIDAVVSPVDHTKFDPEVVKTEFPQLFETVTSGVDGTVPGTAAPDPAALVQPLTV